MSTIFLFFLKTTTIRWCWATWIIVNNTNRLRSR